MCIVRVDSGCQPLTCAPFLLFCHCMKWEWGNQDSFNGNVGTVLGNGGGDGWYRVQWDTTNTSNSYQYMESHQDLVSINVLNCLGRLFSWLISFYHTLFHYL